MSKILDMPKLSPTMEEGVLSAWHKREGDAVAVDDLLADVETDKATMEFRAFDKGVLLKLLVPAGATVKLGQPVAVVGAAGEDISAVLANLGGSAPPHEGHDVHEARYESSPHAAAHLDEAPSAADDGYRSVEVHDEDEESGAKTALLPPRMPDEASTAPSGNEPRERDVVRDNVLDRTEHLPAPRAWKSEAAKSGRVVASPYVRKTAREMGVELAGAQGSGPGGRVEASDLATLQTGGSASRSLAVPKAQPAPAQGAGLAAPVAHPLSMMRKTIARRLAESKKTVPHFYLTIDVDAGEVMDLRADINGELAGRAPADGAAPLKVSVNDLLIKACAVALVRVPACNAQFTPDAILYHQRVDISVPVAVADGLVTPVVRNADQKTVVAIATEVRELAARARAKKLTVEEMTEGTFSISNLGMFGIDEFAAVINPPEGAILAVGQVREVPVVRDGALAVGKKMALTLSCDHRVVDGAVGAAFLAELRALLEHPMRILTG